MANEKTVYVKAKVPVDHDGERHEPGSDAFSVTEKQAYALLAVDAVELVEIAADTAKKGGSK
jgi:hypothetical protein